jgi:hypothetical protein
MVPLSAENGIRNRAAKHEAINVNAIAKNKKADSIKTESIGETS